MESNYTEEEVPDSSQHVDEKFHESDPDSMRFSLPPVRCPDGKVCRGETACKSGWNNTYSCACMHTALPPRKGWVCDRVVVTDVPTPWFPFRRRSGNTNSTAELRYHAHRQEPIPVLIGDIARDIRVALNANANSSSSTPPFETLTHSPAPGYLGIDNKLVIPIVSLGIILTALFSLTLCFLKRKSLVTSFRRKRLHGKIDEPSMDNLGQGSHLLPHNRFVNNPTYEAPGQPAVPLLPSVPIVKQSEIMSMVQIGEGCFGKVFKGDMNGELVAVKVIKKEHAEEVLREIETMTTFHHPHILELLGIAQNEESDVPWLIFELMEYGDLISILRKIRSQTKAAIQNEKRVAGNESEPMVQPNVTKDSLLDMAYQISEGMKYLSSQHFVHRDLAARNCLLGTGGIVKISDFGLSRDVYTCDYYKVSGSRSLPVRWMAPECVLYGRFTLESDVWAYGVLLWEMYTWGIQPYYGHSNEEVVQLILDGMLLSPPSDCPPLICELMAGSWKTNPKDRLTFVEINDKFLRNTNTVRRTCTVTMEQSAMDDNYEKPKASLQAEYMEVV